jgi:hypothetical protein
MSTHLIGKPSCAGTIKMKRRWRTVLRDALYAVGVHTSLFCGLLAITNASLTVRFFVTATAVATLSLDR